MNKDEFIIELRSEIKNNPEQFCLIAQKWNIEVLEENQQSEMSKLNFGKYGSTLKHSYPFYKSISRIVDPSKLK